MDQTGFGALVGVQEPVSTTEGRARVTLRAEERHSNAGGTIHGGVIATLVDVAMGSALRSLSREGELPVTIEMKINYLEPGQPGVLVAQADVRKRGRRFTVVQAEVLQEYDGEVLAEAMGTYTTVE
jgi:uncharacterized protein (TIGR00369 family)